MKKALLLSLLVSLNLTSTLRADTVVVFNEIMYHPSINESNMEWLELRNQFGVDVDISGWRLAGAAHFTFPSNTVVPGGGFIVVALSPTNLPGLTNVYGPFIGRLGNNGDRLELHNNSDRMMDEMEYGTEGDWPVAPDGSGVSLAKLDRNSASAPAGNWVASAQVGGTPGTDNFPSYGGSIAQSRLVSADNAWKYNDSGLDLGDTWRDPATSDASWSTALLLTNRPITTLFNTGLGDNRVALAANTPDPHWILAAGAQGTVGASALAIQNHGNWLANDANSTWIGVLNPGTSSVNAGNYNYRTTFLLDGFLPSTVQLNVAVAVDNDLANVLVNGNAIGMGYSGFTDYSATNPIIGGFVSGTNTLEFQTINTAGAASPHGFRAVLTGTGLVRNPDATLAAGRTTYYFRRSFAFSGNPANASLRLRGLVADGAVFYLNGVEVHRQNMPEGAISYATPALSVAPTPIDTGYVPLLSDSLRNGSNILAVEVHLAEGSTNAVTVGADLYYSALPFSFLPLVVNETGASTNQFWLELMNYGGAPLALDGFAIYHDGDATNHTYTFPSNNITIAPGGFLAITNLQLGFQPDSGDKLYLVAPGGTNMIDAVVVKKTVRGRSPDGTGKWFYAAAPSPGAPNQFSFLSDIVINEIMYQHQRIPVTDNPILQPSPEQWVELYNRGSNAVDLTNWELDGGIGFQFTNIIMQPGGYLVVAKNSAALRISYPGANIIGNYSRNLSRKGELIILKDPIGNPVNQVRYYDSAPWPEYANGGGSSLELRDPLSDNSKPEAWDSSDESAKVVWQDVSYSMVAGIPAGNGQPTQWNDFVMGLLGGGECLVDDLQVVDLSSNSLPIIANGNFEDGDSGWRMIGTHTRSRVIVDPENPANHVLHIVASGPQEHMHNHIERTLINSPVVNGHNYQISYRARWIAGNHFLNTRLYFNRCARTTSLGTAVLNGTPGVRNSRFETNAGPTFSGLQHAPVTPQPGEPVTVSVSVQDPQGVTACELRWSANSGGWSTVPMVKSGDGSLYTANLPGLPAWTIVQFYVHAVDGLGAAANFPAKGPESGALYAVADGQANLTLGHNVRIILTPDNTALLHAITNVQSNDRLPCTVVYDESRAYYNCEVRLRSSERGRYSDTRTTWHIVFPTDDKFNGVHPCMIMHRSGTGDSTANKQQEILVRHMLTHAGNIPGTYPDLVRVIAPRSVHTGPVMFAPRHKDQFIETAYENGQDGIVWKFELIYYPTSTNQYGYKNPNPDNVIGTDFGDIGNDKETYRYNYILKNHRDADDWSQLMAFAKAHSLTGTALDQATRPVMDVDEWMRSWAFLSLCGIGDTYTFGNNHNLILYQRPSDNRILAFLWDMSFSFNRAATASLVGDQNLSKVINLPGNLRLFYGHMLEIIDTTYNTSYMNRWINHYVKFTPGQNFSSVSTYIQQRVDYTKSVIAGAGGNTNFAIANPTYTEVGDNMVTLSGTAPVTVRTFTLNGIEYPLTWSNIYTWSLTLPLNSVSNTLNFLPYDITGVAISNLATSITIVNTGQVAQAQGSVLFTEIMYNPAISNASYLELFNSSSNFIFDISGWRINGLGDYTFPGGTYLTNGQYLILARDRAAFAKAYGATPVFDEFNNVLDTDGETLTLFQSAAGGATPVVVDKVRYEAARPWPSTQPGISLQLIDSRQDNARVGNWTAGAIWRYYSYTGNAGTAAGMLYIFPSGSPGACDYYIDDIRLVFGTNAGVGTNLLRNPDFESGSNTYWGLRAGVSNSVVTTAVSHGGRHSLHVVAGGAGGLNFSIQTAIVGYLANSNYTLSYWYLSGTNIGGLTAQIGDLRVQFTTVNNKMSWTPSTPGLSNSVAANLPAFPNLWLNEVQPQNVGTRTNELGQYAPWVELYNPGSSPQSLDGLYLANNYTSNQVQWAFPSNTIVQPGEFKLVWLDAVGSTPTELHANFTIPQSTGSIALVRIVNSMPQVLDYLNYSGVGATLSYGDYPDGQPFSRQVFFNVTPGGTNDATHGFLYINEWVADNIQNSDNGIPGVIDPADNDHNDWFEIYNPNNFDVNLSKYFLSDATNLITQFRVPDGYIVPANGYLLVWADNETGQNRETNKDLHVNFQLSRAGEHILLHDVNTNLIDRVTFGPQTNNISQGRYADGSTNILFMASTTPGAPNFYFINQPPTLSPISDQAGAVGQPITINAAASDPDLPWQTLTWHLGTGAPAGAAISTNGVFTWTPTVANGTNLINIWVEDNGLPRLTASTTFAIVLASQRFQLTIQHGESNIALTCPTVTGRHYRLEYAESLSPGTPWLPVPGMEDLTSTGDTLIISLNVTAETNRFYRIVELQP